MRRFSWVLIFVAGVVAYVVVLHVMLDTKNVNFFPSLLLLGAITVRVAVLVFAEGGGRNLPVGPWVIATTAVAGGVVGTVAAGVLEYDTLRTMGTLPMVVVGIIEEGAKLIVPIVVYLGCRPKDPRGGVVDIAVVDQTLLLRALLSPAGHVAWTGFTVAMLWRNPTATRRGRAVWAFLGSYAVAVALHATWDGANSLPVHIVVAVVSLVVRHGLVHAVHESVPAGPGPVVASAA